MSPKDQRIINNNPNVSPYDLQMTFGLSQGGFNELIALQDEKASNVLKAGVPRLSPNLNAAIPVTTVAQPFTGKQSAQVTLRGKKGSGNGTLMSRSIAEAKVAKYPDDYEII